MYSKIDSIEDNTTLEWLMMRELRTILEFPTKDQIYDFVSLKLGSFYKRYWQNKQDYLKKNTRKAGEIIALAEKMREITRDDDRLIKVCAYAREVKKFQYGRYQEWKEHIWIDLDEEEQVVMKDYVENLTPPAPKPGEKKTVYDQRERKSLYSAYKHMKRGMLLVEIFEKIWTIRKYRSNQKYEDEKKHINLAKQMLKQMKSHHPTLKRDLNTKMGQKQWDQIEQLW